MSNTESLNESTILKLREALIDATAPDNFEQPLDTAEVLTALTTYLVEIALLDGQSREMVIAAFNAAWAILDNDEMRARKAALERGALN